MRRQLRPFYDQAGLDRVYARRYDHTRWPDHIARVSWTADVLRDMAPASVADLSCGDGEVINKAGLSCPVHLGDLRGDYEYHGPIEQTVLKIPEVDVFVCSETLEHLADPDLVLRQIYEKARRLLLTTPVGETGDANPEHYWGWDAEDIAAMLRWAGWRHDALQPALYLPAGGYYVFQMWQCHR